MTSNWKTIIWSFGSGLHGNIAKFGFKNTQTPHEIDLGQEPVEIFSNSTNSAFCRMKNGEVYAWGRNENCVLANPSNIDTSIPQQIYIPPTKQISISTTHGAAISEDNQVYTWGSRALGRGMAETSISQIDKAMPTKIYIPVQQGQGRNINFLENQTKNSDEKNQNLKLSTTDQKNFQNFQNSSSSQSNQTIIPTSITVGCNHSVVSMSDGSVWGWGIDSDGAIGLNTGEKMKNHEIPMKISIPYNDPIEKVISGQRHTLFKTYNGDLYSCGDNALGQTGVQNASRWVKEPSQVIFPKTTKICEGSCTIQDVKVKEMSAGPTHTCIVSTDNDLYCWGNNSNGQLGLALSDEVNRSVGKMLHPVKNHFFEQNLIKIKNVSCGAAHTSVIDSNDQLWFFGSGREGQLSNLHNSPLTGGNYDTPILVKIPNFIPKQIELGNSTTYILGTHIQSEDKEFDQI